LSFLQVALLNIRHVKTFACLMHLLYKVFSGALLLLMVVVYLAIAARPGLNQEALLCNLSWPIRETPPSRVLGGLGPVTKPKQNGSINRKLLLIMIYTFTYF